MPSLDLGTFNRLTDRLVLLVDEMSRVCGATSELDRLLGDTTCGEGSRLVERSLLDLATDRQGVLRYLENCRQTNHSIPGRMVLVGRDGADLVFRCRGCRVSRDDSTVALDLQPADEDSSFASLNHQLQRLQDEVVRRRRVEIELRDALELNELILSSAAEGIIALDVDGIVTLCNAAALRMLGFPSEDELIGQDFRNVLSDRRAKDRDTSEVVSALLRPRETRDLRPEREILWRNDGSSFPIEYLARLIRRSGEVVGWVVSFVDITQRLEEEEKQRAYATVMHEAQKLESLGRLAGGVAHDFNNFLLTIIGNAEMARRGLGEPSPERLRLDAVLAASHSAADLCRQMLAFSDRGKVPMKPLLLSRLVQEISDLLRISIVEEVSVHLDLSKDELAIDGDASQLRQVVMNLLINASDAIGQGPGEITIRIGSLDVDAEEFQAENGSRPMALSGNLKSGRHTVLDVIDSGHGMEPEQAEKIFDPYFSTKDAGHGLGLAATLGIVRDHRGAISVESTPGVGSKFRILFPESTLQAGDPTEKRKPDEQWRHTGTILVVDDNESVARVVEIILKEVGFEVHTFHQGQDAIDRFKRHPHKVSAVILDVSMPKLDGFQVFEALRDIDPTARIVMSSGLEDESSTRDRLGEGLADFLPKPYSRTQLVGTLRRVLEHGQA